MINWINLAGNALWILGLSLGLAALSYASWAASLQGVPLRKLLQQPAYQRLFSLAGALFCLGLAATAAATWETVIWALLALAFLLQLALTWRPAPEPPAEGRH